jgi:hypothetical protein
MVLKKESSGLEGEEQPEELALLPQVGGGW